MKKPAEYEPPPSNEEPRGKPRGIFFGEEFYLMAGAMPSKHRVMLLLKKMVN